MKFVDMDGRYTEMPNTVKNTGKSNNKCWVCEDYTSYYDYSEKVYLCSEECRNKHCDLGASEHIDYKLDC